ncbi:MAG: type I restriction endonuclease subunit R [Firmicutes bacterium]|nr:type I restriction endonuclease subunit R [Bacillota bacterium]
MTKQNDIIAENNFSTVVAEYIPLPKNDQGYQSEKELEADFLMRLEKLGYERIYNLNEAVLKNNLRLQLEKLNKAALGGGGFSDKEWTEFFGSVLANGGDGVRERTRKLQAENIFILNRDDGSQINIRLLDKKNIFNNSIQVFNQYEEGGTKYKGIYDVTVLVNGLPLVHIELKRRGVEIKEAFNQIARYSRDNFFGGSGLFDWVQIFVISNGTETKYYSNTTREQAAKEGKSTNATARPQRKTSHSFEFTSYWADAQNRNIVDLVDFAETFFNKGTLLNIITKYCVFTADELLLVMRPYQIVASEKIIGQIKSAKTYKKIGTIDAGGYVWHTTGSGKTLTSFKTAQLATSLDYIDKVLFVVDRKDLDYQTIKEFEKFGGKDSVSGNVNTKLLGEQLENPNSRVIVTTIQKLNIFVAKHSKHEIYGKNCVIIFDECHRSQFGEMHKRITRAFSNYFLFGFTGTPIFVENSQSGLKPTKNKKGEVVIIKTTEQIFGKCLHAYTIVDAIRDSNVLQFRVDLVDTIRYKDGAKDVKVWAIDREEALQSPERIAKIVEYIIDNYNAKTYRIDGGFYEHSQITNTVALAKAKLNNIVEVKAKRKVKGFNSIFAVDSIASAKLYYDEFARRQAERGSDLRIATIFCYSPNEDVAADFLEEEFETEHLDASSRDFLARAIDDYNKMFDTNWDTSSDSFGSYYKDVSMRVKNKEIDILIVVNMFLTGFDATTLNTLWVDKNLRYHGLIQAFSRTNRILNAQKKFGNIVTFRKLEKQLNDALKIFGDKNAKGVVVIRPFKDYYEGYEDKPGYKQIVEELRGYCITDILSGVVVLGEAKEKEFIKLFGAFLKVENILSPFDEFKDKRILTPRERQDYQSYYLNLNAKYRGKGSEEEVSIIDDLVFEIELIKQLTVNIDYILMMVEKYQKAKDGKDKELALADIKSTIDSRPELRSKKELILGFIAKVNNKTNVVEEWIAHVKAETEKEVSALIEDESLNEELTRKFLTYCLAEGEVKETGTDIDNLLPPMSMFDETDNRANKKKTVLAKLKSFLERFLF